MNTNMNLCAVSLSKTSSLQLEDGGSRPTPALHFPRQLVVSLCPRNEVREFIEQHHYSHSINGVKNIFCFRVDVGGTLVGALLFGGLASTAWRRYATSEAAVIELRRLVLLDAAGKNCESRVVGWALRWLKKNAPHIDTVVSYADPLHGHQGTIYQASNFVRDGVSASDKGFRDPSTGKVYHSRALKTKYANGEFKPFVKRLRAMHAAGELEIVSLPGKHRYIYQLTTGTH